MLTDADLDTLVAAADPVRARVPDVPDELRASIVAAPLAPRRRWRRPALGAVAVAAAAVVALLAVVPGHDSGRTAWAAPLVKLAESSPLLLLDADGWSVTRADEYGAEGEMTFSKDGRSADLHWRGGPIGMWQKDRAHDAPLVTQREVLGARAQVTRYAGSNDFTAIWEDGERVLEFRTVSADLAAFEALLGALKRVDVDAWLSAMPPSVIKSGERAGVVREMLADIPQPPGFDAAALEEGQLKDRYQLGAEVTGAVGCAWIARWAAARKRGDNATAEAAAAAMATSRDWKILRDMQSGGMWPQVFWDRAAAMRDGVRPDGKGGVVEATRSALGCGQH